MLGVWISIILLAAVIVAAAAGLLAHAGGANIPNAVLIGARIGAGAVGLLLVLLQYATSEPF